MDKVYYIDETLFDLAVSGLIEYLQDTFGPNLAKMPQEQLYGRVMQAFEHVANGLITRHQADKLETTMEEIEDSLIAQANEIVDEVVNRLRK